MPLQTLVDIASSLFDESNRIEQNLTKGITAERQERQHHYIPQHRPEIREEPQPRTPVSVPLHAATGVATTTSNRPTCGIHLSSSKNHNTSQTNHQHPKIAQIFLKPPNFQCCTRAGFLSRLRSVLSDQAMSDVLAWMPDGEAFTIVSPKRFAKKGLVFELFGIKKMSSFLRRLNQLGFARVRDPTDPTNLDVFRKKGFSAVAAPTEATNGTRAATQPQQPCLPQRSESPRSTFFAPAMAPTTKIIAASSAPPSPVDYSSPTSSSSSSSSITTASSLTMSCTNDAESTGSSVSSLTLSIPGPGFGVGPVRLRPRGESSQRSTTTTTNSIPSTPASTIVAAANLHRSPPKQILLGGAPATETPIIANTHNKHPMTPAFSPNTLESLGVPKLGGTPLRSPPILFVAEWMQRLMVDPAGAPAIPVEARCEASAPRAEVSSGLPPRSLMTNNREYLSLYQAAENEANAILRRGAFPSHRHLRHHHLEPSVIATVELLRGGYRNQQR